MSEQSLRNRAGHTLEEYVEARLKSGDDEERAQALAALDYYTEAPIDGWGDD